MSPLTFRDGAYWRSKQRERPRSIEEPGPGQESVWDYPRPPIIERVDRRITVEFNDLTIADTVRAIRVIETASPPAYYLPTSDIRMDRLERHEATTLCEWKGVALYWSVRVGDRIANRAAWSYPRPAEGFGAMAEYVAFYAQKMDECRVADEIVRPQPGAYYGGWITPDICGPFKGGPGSANW